MDKITINGVTLEPEPLDDAVERAASPFALIPWSSLTPEQHVQVEEEYEVLEMVQGGACICRRRAMPRKLGADPQAAPVEAFRYSLPFKLDKSAFAPPAPGAAVVGTVVLHPGEATGPIKAVLTASPGATVLDEGQESIRVSAPLAVLETLARQQSVRHIEPAADLVFSCDVATGIVAAEQLWNLDILGEGETIAICDSGFDLGTLNNVHPAFAGRVQALFQIGTLGPQDANGHGTLVAGCALGDGVSGELHVRGAAPRARLVSQGAEMQNGKPALPEDLDKVYLQARGSGARVHNLSINDASSQNIARYTILSRNTDKFVVEHRDAVVCISVGNTAEAGAAGTILPGSVLAPATAKNCIAVGASENLRPENTSTYGDYSMLLNVEPFKSDVFGDSAEGMAAFSSRGPSVDGRIRPDVTAPGTCVLGPATRGSVLKAGNIAFGQTADPLYCFSGGTSFASGFASGACALIREWLRKRRSLPEPSAALVKALLINGATPMAGQHVPSEAGVVPSSAQGFGRINVALSIGVDGATVGFLDEGEELSTGMAITRELAVPAGASLKVTLVWTDPVGETLCNDLDLEVIGEGLNCHGNRGPGDPSFDRVNNVEQVSCVAPGPVKVSVRAERVSVGKQSFALVWRFI